MGNRSGLGQAQDQAKEETDRIKPDGFTHEYQFVSKH